MGMPRAAVEEAMVRGPRIEVGLVTSNLRVRGRRGVTLVAAAAALRSKPLALPLGARLTNGEAPEQRAGVHRATARSTSAGGEKQWTATTTAATGSVTRGRTGGTRG